jgi:signal transduction histidine kinase
MKVIEILLLTIIILVSGFIFIQALYQIEMMEKNIEQLKKQIIEVKEENSNKVMDEKSIIISPEI